MEYDRDIKSTRNIGVTRMYEYTKVFDKYLILEKFKMDTIVFLYIKNT